MVFGHNRPFQKTSKTGGGQDAGCTSGGAFAADDPKLRVTSNTRRVVDQSFLDAYEVPGRGALEVWLGKGLCLPFGGCRHSMSIGLCFA